MMRLVVAVCVLALARAAYLKRDDLTTSQLKAVERSIAMMTYDDLLALDKAHKRQIFCGKGEFNCGDSCIPFSKLCDDTNDCPSGEDEPAKCASRCAAVDAAGGTRAICARDAWICVDAAEKCTAKYCKKTIAELTESGICAKRSESDMLKRLLEELAKKTMT